MFKQKKNQKVTLCDFQQQGDLINKAKINQETESNSRATPLFSNKPFKFRGKRLNYHPINKNVIPLYEQRIISFLCCLLFE